MPKPNKSTYNGWKNYATWNVALWINNDEGLYRIACRFMHRYTGRTPYADLVDILPGTETPDGVSWTDPSLSKRELNAMLRELLE